MTHPERRSGDLLVREELQALREAIADKHIIMNRLDTIEEHVNHNKILMENFLNHMRIVEEREARIGPILDKLVRDEVRRGELYEKVKTQVFGWGIIAILTTLIGIIWWSVKEFFSR